MNRTAQALTQLLTPAAVAIAAAVTLMTAAPAYAQSADQVKADKPAPKAKAKTDAPQEPKKEATPIGGFNYNPKPNKEDLL